MGGGATWVRALDGVSFDVKRGEVFCLVGESGCGKTTTGKALLRLVEATEGDILFEMPQAEYDRFDTARQRPASPETAEELNGLRRKYSLSWKETSPWTPIQLALLTGFLGAGFLLSILVPAFLVGLFPGALAASGVQIGVSLLSGFVLAFFAVLPPTRPSRRTPAVAAIGGLIGYNFIPVVAEALLPSAIPSSAGDPWGALAYAWGNASFAMIIGLVFVAIVAGGISRFALSIRTDREGLRGIRVQTLRRRLHLVFQDPYESLNPKQSVFEIVSEPLIVNRISHDPEEITALVTRSLEDAGLRPATEFMFRFPHELSGGQRQRVSIAAALALEPDFIVADEPVSMLDVSIRTEILELMMELRGRRGITYLFITHDIGLAWILADRIAVMYLGKIVEQGTSEEIVAHPKHPYTQALISVVPSPDPRHKTTRVILQGERPDPIDIPTGCRFHPRCPVAFEKCGWNATELKASLESAPQGLPPDVGAITVGSPTRLRVESRGGPAERLAEDLRAFFQGRRDQLLIFRGVAGVKADGRGVEITMQPWSEPELVEVSPGNLVACHLVSPSSPHPPSIPALA